MRGNLPTHSDEGRLVALIQCGKRKRPLRSQAAELYIGSLFVKSLAYARHRGAGLIFILSAEHGVLALETEIEPYEKTLKNMGIAERVAWRNRIVEQLRAKTMVESDRFLVLASSPYREGLEPVLRHMEVPMVGMRQGIQLQFLTQALA
jgi:hypothetical protein